MPASAHPERPDRPAPDAVTFLAASAALKAIDEAVRDAHAGTGDATGSAPDTERAQALASLQLLREVREQLAGWETGLIETARAAGASWADLADPLGVASRQAAERRYLRLRPGSAGSTGEQRVQATRDRRAGDRSITTWARENAADLRSLAGQITALADLPSSADGSLDRLRQALGTDDAAALVTPLGALHPHLAPGHRQLADRVDSLTRHAGRLREDTANRRRSG
ncbi:HSP18 transcriptional regulator [Streptomyces sp. ATCC51928]|uniref:HSP18 transcriptional regulator n=1 Tax=Streptomyces caviscabies TaxID=90079 RepID=A0ABW2MLD8_9ACTN|nr:MULTISPECIES: HSP18 transcriptional regulator [unclassified Streptomyces]MDX3504065.1 HSP18 transcriptional regulator [Streptomyces sp. ATCC51928]MDX5524892.1 HSP18 transcriptional regulator [Streptomyces sp. DE06-01C]